MKYKAKQTLRQDPALDYPQQGEDNSFVIILFDKTDYTEKRKYLS